MLPSMTGAAPSEPATEGVAKQADTTAAFSLDRSRSWQDLTPMLPADQQSSLSVDERLSNAWPGRTEARGLGALDCENGESGERTPPGTPSSNPLFNHCFCDFLAIGCRKNGPNMGQQSPVIGRFG